MAQILSTVAHYVKTATLLDVLDILVVAYLIYRIILFIHGTNVRNIVRGIVVLIVLFYISDFLELNVLKYILKNTMQIGLIALIIVFQPELRKALENLGTSKISELLKPTEEESDRKKMIQEVVEASTDMSRSRTGALIVFERKTKLDDIVTAATELDAKPTSQLIQNIFFEKAALHDGAMIIRGDRILAAGCVLPLSENEALPKALGTRHRAGIGITEVTDAISLIVSEETGYVSIAMNGEIKRNMAASTVENLLTHELIVRAQDDEEKERKKTGRLFEGWRAKER